MDMLEALKARESIIIKNAKMVSLLEIGNETYIIIINYIYQISPFLIELKLFCLIFGVSWFYARRSLRSHVGPRP